MDGKLGVTPRVSIPLDEIEISFARSGGPGGQNVNKVASKVEVRWHPEASRALSVGDRAWLLEKLASRLTRSGALVISSELTRDQGRNRADALAKLAGVVRSALVRPKPRKKTKPSRGSVERRITEKKKRGERKRDRGRLDG